MRIEAYTKVQQVYNTAKSSQVQKASGERAKDQLQISSVGKDYQTARAAVAAASDIREDVTASIKARIDAGTYEVSTGSFADKLLDKFNEMR